MKVKKEASKVATRRALIKFRKKLNEPKEVEPGELRGRYRPTEKEFVNILGAISEIKNFIVRKQAYKMASSIRDIERTILTIRDSHPEEMEGESFVVNIDSDEVDFFLKQKHEGVKSYRVGKTAYDATFKKKIAGKQPLFVTLNSGWHLAN